MDTEGPGNGFSTWTEVLGAAKLRELGAGLLGGWCFFSLLVSETTQWKLCVSISLKTLIPPCIACCQDTTGQASATDMASGKKGPSHAHAQTQNPEHDAR